MRRVLNLRADARMLAIARIAIGANAAFASLEAWRMLSRVLTPIVVKLPFLPWVPELPLRALPVFIAIWWVAALFFAIGWKTRVAGAVLTAVTGYTLLLDQQTYSNHLYLLVLIIFLLTVSDSGAAWSLDARRGARGDVAAWPIVLLKIQVSIVYLFSALSKITPSYLGGEILTRSLKQQGLLAVPQSWRVPAVLSALAAISILVELFIAFGLWSSRLRLFAVIAGVGFHVLILAVLDSSRLSLGIFALDMVAVYVLFFDAGFLTRWKSRMRRGQA